MHADMLLLLRSRNRIHFEQELVYTFAVKSQRRSVARWASLALVVRQKRIAWEAWLAGEQGRERRERRRMAQEQEHSREAWSYAAELSARRMAKQRREELARHKRHRRVYKCVIKIMKSELASMKNSRVMPRTPSYEIEQEMMKKMGRKKKARSDGTLSRKRILLRRWRSYLLLWHRNS